MESKKGSILPIFIGFALVFGLIIVFVTTPHDDVEEVVVEKSELSLIEELFVSVNIGDSYDDVLEQVEYLGIEVYEPETYEGIDIIIATTQLHKIEELDDLDEYEVELYISNELEHVQIFLQDGMVASVISRENDAEGRYRYVLGKSEDEEDSYFAGVRYRPESYEYYLNKDDEDEWWIEEWRDTEVLYRFAASEEEILEEVYKYKNQVEEGDGIEISTNITEMEMLSAKNKYNEYDELVDSINLGEELETIIEKIEETEFYYTRDKWFVYVNDYNIVDDKESNISKFQVGHDDFLTISYSKEIIKGEDKLEVGVWVYSESGATLDVVLEDERGISEWRREFETKEQCLMYAKALELKFEQ